MDCLAKYVDAFAKEYRGTLNMSDKEKNYYDADYYRSHCGDEYERGHGWEEIFGNYADRIVKEINPRKTLDVGSAKGFFVEALRDRGVEAYGIDISDYAIAEVREDIKPFCKVQSALLPIEEKYDLITCIEVLEHLDSKDIPLAIQRMCEAADDIIFSSTPFDYEEESHVSIHAPEYWVEQFAYNGFYHDVQYDCSYIAVQTMRFRKADKSKVDLIREYESELFQKQQEIVAARQRYKLSEENVTIYKEAYQKHVDMINQELNPKISELTEQVSEIAKKTESEMKQRCRVQIEEEVKKRKYFEEKYYQNMDALEEVKNINAELQHARATIVRLQQQLGSGNNPNAKIWKLMKQKYASKYREKKLLRKDISFWKPVFDAKYYAEYNKDIFDVFGTDEKALLKHFIRYGMYEGRIANKFFDINVYMSCNPDVAEERMYDRRLCYLHYITDGMMEGRTAK